MVQVLKYNKLHIIMLGVVVLSLLLKAPMARADEYDICVHVLDEITVPVNEYRCWDAFIGPIPNPECLLAPHCCTPGLCKVSPDCGLLRVVHETVASAGDFHCFEGITASNLFDRWVNRQIAMGADILTGGLLSAIYPLVLDNIDLVALAGNHLPAHVQNLLGEMIRPIYSAGATGYTYDNVATVKIVNENKNELTKFWMQKGAITLGPVVVLTDEDYHALMDPSNAVDLYGLLLGPTDNSFSIALNNLVHEMVHVNQYAELGRETFTTNYLLNNAPLVTEGYGFDEFEQEAYSFEAFMAEYLGGEYCNDAMQEVNHHINEYLDRPPISCRLVEDADKDRNYNHLDNCPTVANPDQTDLDGNGVGDVCEFHVWLPVVLSILHD